MRNSPISGNTYQMMGSRTSKSSKPGSQDQVSASSALTMSADNESPSMHLGEYLRKHREQNGLTRTKFAKLASISHNSLVRYERAGYSDGQYPPLLKLAKICELLSLDPRDVFNTLIHPGEFEPEQPLFSFSDLAEGFREKIYDHPPEMVEKAVQDFQSMFEKIQEAVVPFMAETQKRIDSLEARSKENGPDQNDPSRHPQNPSTAVDAALTPPKEEDQT